MIQEVRRSAPAKLNLGLDVVGKRADGYHCLETVFQTISLSDFVTVHAEETVSSANISVLCDVPGVPCDCRNIAWKAAERYLKSAQINANVRISIEKNIPTEAGLGGGSTDAAAVLLALKTIFDTPISAEQLHEIAASLGADVPFFLYGGTAYAEGIGEKIEALPTFSCDSIVVAKGSKGVSTAAGYAAIDAAETLMHPPVSALRAAIVQKQSVREIAGFCGNLFETVTQNDEIRQIHDTMLSARAYCSVMTGSGTAVFGLFPDVPSAQGACATLRECATFVEICHTI